MFISFLHRKFANKCKRAVKCIIARIELIRKKKQVTAQFLKQDVADLIAGGHELNAFKRNTQPYVTVKEDENLRAKFKFTVSELQLQIHQLRAEFPSILLPTSQLVDPLIVEINLIPCYDMIEQFCECIMNQLPALRKQSKECPKEAMEAVSTLIFAAARFPDLPELCHLRQVFTERYRDHMDSSVNAEFAGRIGKKTFSKEEKLQFMQDIAEEFSVKWDSKSFDPSKYDKTRKEMIHGSSLTNAVPSRKEDMSPPKDIHVISSSNNGESVYPESMKPPHDGQPIRSHEAESQEGEHKFGLAVRRTEEGHSEQSSSADEKEVISVKPLTRHVSPLSTKPDADVNHVDKGGKVNGANGTVDDDNKLQSREGLDQFELEKESARPLNKKVSLCDLNPPYVKPKINISPTKGDQAIQETAAGIHDMPAAVSNAEKPKPVSVRRSRKPPVIETEEDDNVVEKGNSRPSKGDGTEKRHGSRNTPVMDGEEMAMDEDILHCSRKVVSPGRTVSVPREPVSSVEARVPIRAISMQPDSSSNNGGGVHPMLPDYDQVAASLAALKNA